MTFGMQRPSWGIIHGGQLKPGHLGQSLCSSGQAGGPGALPAWPALHHWGPEGRQQLQHLAPWSSGQRPPAHGLSSPENQGLLAHEDLGGGQVWCWPDGGTAQQSRQQGTTVKNQGV